MGNRLNQIASIDMTIYVVFSTPRSQGEPQKIERLIPSQAITGHESGPALFSIEKAAGGGKIHEQFGEVLHTSLFELERSSGDHILLPLLVCFVFSRRCFGEFFFVQTSNLDDVFEKSLGLKRLADDARRADEKRRKTDPDDGSGWW